MNIFFKNTTLNKKSDLGEDYLKFKTAFRVDLMCGRLANISVRNNKLHVITNFCELVVTKQYTYLETIGLSNLSYSFSSGYVEAKCTKSQKSLFLTKRECEDFLFFLLNVSDFDVMVKNDPTTN